MIRRPATGDRRPATGDRRPATGEHRCSRVRKATSYGTPHPRAGWLGDVVEVEDDVFAASSYFDQA
jgi:hypothetical protein